ncbi:TPA_asm: hypothetical protein [Porphyromonas phage phage023a_KCOM2797]|uniref:Uncharacterized protein n=1 Tax=Porphyromonas phage phage023a_KCOM2797 TaxID=3154113 RepID=A0AAT9JMK7_9CAUD
MRIVKKALFDTEKWPNVLVMSGLFFQNEIPEKTNARNLHAPLSPPLRAHCAPPAGNVTGGGWGCPFEARVASLASHRGKYKRDKSARVGSRALEGARRMLLYRLLPIQPQAASGRGNPARLVRL